MTTLWQEPDLAVRQDLFRDVISEAEMSERVLILFGLLRNTLAQLSHEADGRRIEANANRALSVIAFLRDGLAEKPDDPFHAAFKRFYNHMHRQIIDALRDRNNAAFAPIARSIATLTSDDNASAFIGHCLEQSELREHRLNFILERLFATTRGPLLHPRTSNPEPAFRPRRCA